MSFFKNYFLVILEKFLRLLVSFFIGLRLVKVVGPDSYGLYATGLAISTLISPLCTFGADNYILKELSSGNDNSTLISSTLICRFAGILLSLVVFCIYSFTFLSNLDLITISFITLVNFQLMAFSVFELIIISRGEYKKSTFIKIASLLIGAVLKLLVLIKAPTILNFITATAIESVIYYLFLYSSVAVYIKQFSKKPNFQNIKFYFINFLPIIITAFIYTAYARIDTVVLSMFQSPSMVGNYAAAVRVSELFNLAIVAMSSIIFPYFSKLFSENEIVFDAKWRVFYKYLFICSFTVSLAVSISSELIISLLFGEKYIFAGKILRVHAWSIFLVSISAGLEIIFYVKNLQKYLMYKVAIAAIFGSAVSFVLTRAFGALGAATGLVVTYTISVFISNLLFKKTRDVFLKSFFIGKNYV